MTETLIYPTPAAASRALCDTLARISDSAMAVRDRFTVALSGGSTPRMAFDLLAGEYGQEVDWPGTYVFWADERCVPPESPESNARLAREHLLNYVRTPLDHQYRILGELPPGEAAQRYDDQLRKFFTSRNMRSARFDLLLLGMGEDGHVASLFPSSPALQERERWAVAVQRPNEPFGRVSLTLPAINSAAHIIVLVTGAEKAGIVARVVQGDRSASTLPAHLLAPSNGTLTWILDEAAAHDLQA